MRLRRQNLHRARTARSTSDYAAFVVARFVVGLEPVEQCRLGRVEPERF